MKLKPSKRVRTQAIGLAFLLVLGCLGWLSIAIYAKAFSSAVVVTLHTDRVGNQLAEHGDVKVRGLVVGEIRNITATADGAEVELAIDRDKVDQLPSNMTARLLPKSLFGQRYVSLIFPAGPPGRPLATGDVVAQDSSHEGVELSQALDHLLPVLQAVQPHKLAASLGAMAQALDGRGEQLGQTLVRMNSYLEELNPHLPTLVADIKKFADVLQTYEDAGPDIIDALADMTAFIEVIAEHEDDYADLLAEGTTASDELTGFLQAHAQTLVRLAASGRDVLEVIQRHSGTFPCLFAALVELKPLVENVLGDGTDQPGVHADVSVTPPGGNSVAVEAAC